MPDLSRCCCCQFSCGCVKEFFLLCGRLLLCMVTGPWRALVALYHAFKAVMDVVFILVFVLFVWSIYSMFPYISAATQSVQFQIPTTALLTTARNQFNDYFNITDQGGE